MTINLSDNDPRVSYDVAAGVTQSSFTVSFEFFDNDDLNVYVDGTLKTLTTDYTVSGGDGSTGTVTMSVTGAAGGSKVVITRDIDLDRTTDFPSSGPFNIASLNTELDRFVAIAADLKDQADRSLQLTDFDVAASLTLPEVDDRKGKTLAFNATSGAVEAGPTISDVQSVADAAADIQTLAHIEDGTDATDAIQTVAGISSNVTTVAGISGNVTTVAGITSNIASVVADEADIGTVAGSISNVNTVAGISSDVTSVAGISANVTTVAGKASFITADFAADLNTLATADIVSDLNTLATSAIVTDLDALADLVSEITSLGAITSDLSTVAGISSNVTTVAGISSNVTTVAGINANVTTVAGISSDVSTVAAANANITTVANANSNISTVASNIADVNNFADTYAISATAPSSPTLGDLWFDTTNNVMKVYGSGGFVNAGSNVNGTANRYNYVVGTSDGDYDGSTTVFPATYEAGYVDVYLNGAKLVVTSDFTATNGTSVTLGTAANSGDVIDIVGYGTFTATTALSLGDNEKVQFGAANDLQIYHDGSDSWITEGGSGTGSLKLRANNLLAYSNSDEPYFQAITNGAFRIYYDGSTKLSTTSTGIDVTGTVTSDGLTVDGGTSSKITIESTNTSGEKGILEFYRTNAAHAVSQIVDEREGDLDGGKLNFKTSDTAGTMRLRMDVDQGGDISFYEDTGTTAKFFWDASAERLGIGTSSPSVQLEVKGSTYSLIRVNGANTDEAGIDFGDADDVDIGRIRYDNPSNTMKFTVNAAERMRIDSSGNLLVGKTAVNNDDNGLLVQPNGNSWFTATGNYPLGINRKTSDGALITFTKDQATVGSIGNNTDFFIASQDGAGLRFTATEALPCSESGATQNGSRSLGSSSARFKDLYLSGGVYLGGTGSANKLDDYEEGTWTPTLPNGGTAVNNYSSYVKVGSLVTAYCYISATSVPNNSSQFQVGGLPFTAHANSNYYAGGVIGYTGSLNTAAMLGPIVANNGAYFYFHRNDGNATSILNSFMGGTTQYFIFQVQYHTAF